MHTVFLETRVHAISFMETESACGTDAITKLVQCDVVTKGGEHLGHSPGLHHHALSVFTTRAVKVWDADADLGFNQRGLVGVAHGWKNELGTQAHEAGFRATAVGQTGNVLHSVLQECSASLRRQEAPNTQGRLESKASRAVERDSTRTAKEHGTRARTAVANTRKLDRHVAMATLPYTTACSPSRMSLPGAAAHEVTVDISQNGRECRPPRGFALLVSPTPCVVAACVATMGSR